MSLNLPAIAGSSVGPPRRETAPGQRSIHVQVLAQFRDNLIL